jgi:hypothetical protein
LRPPTVPWLAGSVTRFRLEKKIPFFQDKDDFLMTLCQMFINFFPPKNHFKQCSGDSAQWSSSPPEEQKIRVRIPAMCKVSFK